MRVHDSIIGLVLFIAGIVICIHSSTFPSQMDGSPGPWLFPMFLSAILAIAGFVLCIKNIKTLKLNEIVTGKATSKGGIINIIAVLLSIVFYVYVSEFLGFLICMFLILLFLMLLLKTKIITALIVSLVADGVIYCIFAKGLLVPLPMGLLGL